MILWSVRISIRHPCTNYFDTGLAQRGPSTFDSLCLFNTLRSLPKMSHTIDDRTSSDDEVSGDQSSGRKRRKLSPSGPLSLATTTSRIKRKSEAKPPTETIMPPTAAPAEKTTFASIGVAPWLVGALAAMEIRKPTGIQKASIPEILKGRDCIGGSRTGTGKTVAFAVPILQKWSEDPCGIFGVVSGVNGS